MDYWTNNEDVDDSATDGTHDEDDIAACPLTRVVGYHRDESAESRYSLHARSHRGISLGNLRNYMAKSPIDGETTIFSKTRKTNTSNFNISSNSKSRFLIVGWKDNLPNLHDLFEREEIEWMLVECIKGEAIIMNSILFIDFVLRTGYKDKPELDEDGKPLLCRTTPTHQFQFQKWSPGDEQEQQQQQLQ
ncbi:unnamed protein product [Trichogramma brassicae]|uniref:Uncharacterized protein n=1 Tax=Trichogramma brassicae TaxID=86971 RepID=A0A6H5HTW8_9HYME|nr:unnamed protein product [Trichogramma brassicae]